MVSWLLWTVFARSDGVGWFLIYLLMLAAFRGTPCLFGPIHRWLQRTAAFIIIRRRLRTFSLGGGKFLHQYVVRTKLSFQIPTSLWVMSSWKVNVFCGRQVICSRVRRSLVSTVWPWVLFGSISTIGEQRRGSVKVSVELLVVFLQRPLFSW